MLLNKGQMNIVNKAEYFYKHSSTQVFSFSGKAGTGKSTVLMAIADRLKIPLHRIAVMSYIGAPAVLLRRKGFLNAKTIHSWLFQPVQDYLRDKDGNIVMDNYLNRPKMTLSFEPKPIDDIDLIFVDEAGSVPYYLKPELESRGIKIIACGDLNQLPPVGDKPAYLYNESDVEVLDEIMRQNSNSKILYLAERAIKGLPIHRGFYGDALVIEEDELTDQMILNSDIVICAKNNTREYINKRIRHDILGINVDIPTRGEKLVCRKNNWNIEVDGISLANGLIGRVVNTPSVYGFDGKNYRIDFKPDLMDSYFPDLVCDYNYLTAPFSQKQMYKNDKYNTSNKLEFAYSITCHTAQGNQFNTVIYLEEFLNKDIQANLNYTGITRASNFLIYVKKKRKYY